MILAGGLKYNTKLSIKSQKKKKNNKKQKKHKDHLSLPGSPFHILSI